MKALGMACLLLVACAHGAGSAPVHGGLRERLAGIAGSVDGRVAVTALNLRTGEWVSINGGVAQPMMSVFKLPLALVALAEVEAGKVQMEQPIPLAEADLRGDPSPLAEAWKRGERAPTLATMLEHLLVESDNTAADKLVVVLGGGPAVTAQLRGLGLEGITITGGELARKAALACPGVPEPPGGWTVAMVGQCAPPNPAVHAAAVVREIEAPPDNATTDAMVELLAQLGRGTLLAAESRAWLLPTLTRTRPGAGRLRGLLPPGTAVAHRTGTGQTDQVSIAVNDVGLVTLPNGDHFAMAVLIAGSHASLQEQEATIARLARAAWDAWAR